MSTGATLRAERSERGFFLALAMPAVAMVAGAALLPILWILRQSFLTAAGAPTLGHYTRLLTSGLTWASIGVTLELSLVTLVGTGLLGIPLALGLAVLGSRAANRALILVMLPLWTSILVRTYGWLVLLRREGPINALITGLGLAEAPLPLVYNFTGAAIGMIHYMLPLFVLPVYAAIRDLDANLVRAAASMGAGFWRCIVTIVLPLAAGGIASGATIVFIYGLGFFITPAVLGGGKVNPVSIRIERTLSAFQDWGGASALGMLLLLLLLGVGATLLMMRRLWTASQRHV